MNAKKENYLKTSLLHFPLDATLCLLQNNTIQTSSLPSHEHFIVLSLVSNS